MAWHLCACVFEVSGARRPGLWCEASKCSRDECCCYLNRTKMTELVNSMHALSLIPEAFNTGRSCSLESWDLRHHEIRKRNKEEALSETHGSHKEMQLQVFTYFIT